MAATKARQPFASLPPRASGGLLHVVVDTPLGSANKFKLDETHEVFCLSRQLPAGLTFPCEFGFIPGTRGEDGDALDVALLGNSPTFVGCLITARLLGVIRATQQERGRRIRNDRLVAIPVMPVNRPRERELRDVAPERLRSLEQFFEAYNRIQGRAFRIEGRAGCRMAARLVSQATNGPPRRHEGYDTTRGTPRLLAQRRGGHADRKAPACARVESGRARRSQGAEARARRASAAARRARRACL